MIMINEISKIGIQEILSTFDDTSLFSLAGTVTQGLLRNKVNSRQEAIDSIINYSENVDNILRRKIVTRDILFAYLHKQNIPIKIQSATKNDLINAIKSLWNTEVNETTNNTTTKNDNLQEMASQFSKWFYSMMNSNEQIGIEHFYPDCKLNVNMRTIEQTIESHNIENEACKVSQLLFQIKNKYNLYFNPNLTTEGVQGRLNPYGLVLVLTCGSLHCNNLIVGIFEQVCGLARDPSSENNWKIKTMQLNLMSQNNVMSPPRLCDTEMTSDLLSLPSH